MRSAPEGYVTQQWYCVALSKEVGRKLLGRQLLERPLVLWRDKEGRVHALGAVCPHRGAFLSDGDCLDDAVACPFHGWEFGTDGKCRLIPSIGPEGKVPRDARVPVYPVEEHDDFVFVWMNPNVPPEAPPPRYPHLQHFRMMPGSYLQEGGFEDTIEVTIDVAHVGHVHARSVASLVPKRTPPMTVSENPDQRGFEGRALLDETHEHSHPPAFTPRWLSKKSAFESIVARVDFAGVAVTATKADGSTDTVFAFVTPHDATRSWFFPGYASNRRVGLVGRLAIEIMGRRLMAEDRRMLAALAPRSEEGLPRMISVSSDSPGLMFRRLYRAAARSERAAGLSPDAMT